MDLRFKQDGSVEIDGARIIWPNFSGGPTKYNREGGKREFNIIIPNDDLMQDLLDAGWRVKVLPAREEGEEPLRYLKVNVNFGGYRPPTIWVMAGPHRRKLREEDVYQLDQISIDHVDLDISPYHSNGYQVAYLQSMVVVQNFNRFEERFAAEEYPEE